MGTMTNQPAQVFRPPESVALASGVSAAVWYPLHEGTGTTVTDKLGSGPDLTGPEIAQCEGTCTSISFGISRPMFQ